MGLPHHGVIVASMLRKEGPSPDRLSLKLLSSRRPHRAAAIPSLAPWLSLPVSGYLPGLQCTTGSECDFLRSAFIHDSCAGSWNEIGALFLFLLLCILLFYECAQKWYFPDFGLGCSYFVWPS